MKNRLPSSLALATLTLLGVAGFVSRSCAQQSTLTNLADTNTISPGSGGATFTGFGYASISGSNVVFQTNNGSNAVFSMSNDGSNLTRIADNTTVPTGGSSALNTFNYTVVSGNHVWFSASSIDSNNTNRPGIYAGTVGVTGASVVAQYGQPSPNSSANTFTGFQFGPRSSGDSVVFYAGSTNNGSAVYRGTAGSSLLTTVADRTTVLPASESGTFRSFSGAPAISGNNVVFAANYLSGGNNRYGVYASNANGLQVLADSNTQVPGLPAGTTFSTSNAFSSTPAVSGDNAVFQASRPGGGSGIYESQIGAGGLLRIADTTTAAPGHDGSTLGTFSSFTSDSVQINAGNIAFKATVDNAISGIFFQAQGGSLVDVVNVNDPLFGSTVYSLNLNAQALDGDHLVFTYFLNDGRTGLAEYSFATAVPEPSSWAAGVFLLGATLVTMRRRKPAA